MRITRVRSGTREQTAKTEARAKIAPMTSSLREAAAATMRPRNPSNFTRGIEALQETGAPRELFGFEGVFENPKEAVNGTFDHAIRAHASRSAAGPQ